MLNLYNAEIFSMAVHVIGNKSRNEKPFLSEKPYVISDELLPLMKEFFLKSFRDKEEVYCHFTHEVDVDYNEVFKIAKEMFSGEPDEMRNQQLSKKLATHLYEQSNHPHIKNGEMYVVYFQNVTLDNSRMDAIGIFKSEIMSDFLKVRIHKGDDLQKDEVDLILEQGINLQKLDKGCLIFNTKEDDGYRVMSVDSNRYDARYWLEHFLLLNNCIDDNYLTKSYLKFCQQFARDVVFPAEDKQEEVMFMNRSVNYFAKNDQFEETDFLNEVLDNPDLLPEFKNYKIDKGEKYNIEDVMTFPIANSAVADARKAIKNVINLDTNITIKLDFVNPESAEKFVEKGWDEEKQMYYYLVYYNKELKS